MVLIENMIDRPPVGTRGTSVASVGNECRDRTECRYCGKWHSGSCRFHDRSCYKCGSICGCFQTFTDYFYFLFSIFNQMNSENFTFTELGPKQWCTAFTTVQSLVRCHLNTWLKTIVVSEFNQRYIPFPWTTKLKDAASQHILEYLNYPLGLTISLGVKSGAKMQLGTQSFLQFLPKSWGESRIEHIIFFDTMPKTIHNPSLPHK